MRNISTLALFLTSAVCVTGCYTSRPELRGTVVNVWTNAPIAGAKVSVDKDPLGNPAAVATTDEKGEFSFKRETGFGGLKKGRWTYPMSVEAPGFAGSTVNVMMSSRKPTDKMEGVRFELIATETSARAGK